MKAKGKKKGISSSNIAVALTTEPKKNPPVNPLAVENAFATADDYGGSGLAARNRTYDSSVLAGLGRFPNIRAGLTPFEDTGHHLNIAEAIYLCQKAYWNIPIFKNTIDLMTEFSNAQLHWEGGNKTSRAFFKALYGGIGEWNMKDQFFREYYRSGNVIMWRDDGFMTKQEASKLTQVYPDAAAGANTIPIPIRYIFLNPFDVRVGANISFVLVNAYYKVLNAYEVMRLKNPQTEQEVRLYNSLSPEQQRDIQNGMFPLIPLDPKQIHVVFYKKQDYEPFAVPMGFCVLDDMDMKVELKKMDRVILRTVESTILHIKMGAPPDEGGINPEAIGAMKEIFNSETVGRVLVTDYTTELQFVIPDLNKVLGPDKYKVINEDITNGLNNIFWGEQKFANAMVKIKVFIERLKDGQDVFLHKFLIPEIKRISQLMGFKTYPIPRFRDIDIQDDVQVAKMLTRLAEIGVLTATETIDAIKDGVLPTTEDSVEDQTEYFDNRQKGLYQPLVGPLPMSYPQVQQQQQAQQAHDINLKAMPKPAPLKPGKSPGRPTGTKAPQTTKNVKPIGTKATFNVAGLKDVLSDYNLLTKAVEKELKSNHKLRNLSDLQKEVANDFSLQIVENEARGNWIEKVADYVSMNDNQINQEACSDIDEISDTHQLSRLSAALLYHSKSNG